MIERETKTDNIPFIATVTTSYSPEFESSMRNYLDFILSDFERWNASRANLSEEVLERESNRFVSKMSVEVGRKYAKLIQNNMVHSFVELSTGNILKPASWRAPTRNFSRGNVFTNYYGNCSWAGAK